MKERYFFVALLHKKLRALNAQRDFFFLTQRQSSSPHIYPHDKNTSESCKCVCFSHPRVRSPTTNVCASSRPTREWWQRMKRIPSQKKMLRKIKKAKKENTHKQTQSGPYSCHHNAIVQSTVLSLPSSKVSAVWIWQSFCHKSDWFQHLFTFIVWKNIVLFGFCYHWILIE